MDKKGSVVKIHRGRAAVKGHPESTLSGHSPTHRHCLTKSDGKAVGEKNPKPENLPIPHTVVVLANFTDDAGFRLLIYSNVDDENRSTPKNETTGQPSARSNRTRPTSTNRLARLEAKE